MEKFQMKLRSVEIKKWADAMNILKLGLNPIFEVMGENEKQALYCSLREPMQSMFKEIHSEFKQHWRFKGKV